MAKYDIDQIRKNLKNAVGGKFSDPDEFRPEKAKSQSEPIKYRFFVLPPLREGEVLKSGPVKKSMDNFYIQHAQHWVNDRPHACPRVYDGSHCALCDYGFALHRECKEKRLGDERKAQINRQWMPTTYHMVNIYFTNWKGNPEELRGKVKYYNAPKTCVDKWIATLLKDDKGDDEDPNAFGVFFDENAAFCFELSVLKEGKTNGYKTSGFLKNNGVPIPIAVNADMTPDAKTIQAILKNRVDLWSKIEVPDEEKVKRLASSLISGDDSEESSSQSSGFDVEEQEQSAPEMPKPAKPVVARQTVLEDEVPFEEEKEDPKPVAKPKVQKTLVKQEEDIDEEDINDLINQLDD